ncbi:MAG: hypothetical protein IPG17_08010 [Sandaracinaceae bacterium]|nr:hypothetical protein [Sandaracinaceae bacterium]
MKSFGWCVVLVLVLGLLGSVGAARAQYEDDTYEGPPADGWMGTEDVLPGLRLGIGPQFATNPNDTMLTGQFLVAADLRFEDNLGAPSSWATAANGAGGWRAGTWCWEARCALGPSWG